MKRNILLHTLTLGVVFSLALQSCKKENGIDNDTVVKRPYGLYITDIGGQLIQTTNGDSFKTIFPPESYPAKALVYSSGGIFWMKARLHVSRDNGMNFNPATTLSPIIAPGTPWQTMLLSALDQKRVYVADQRGRGVYFTEDDGKNWFEDGEWDEGIVGGGINSFTQLKSGTIYAYSNANDSIYKKDNKTDKWTWLQQTKALPFGATYYLSHFNNTLLATNADGNGIFYSNDGQSWEPYLGLPNRKLYTTVAPFDETLLVGTDSMGVYRFQSGQFVPSNNGLGVSTTVYGIAGKDNIYKNGARKHYIYLATSNGLFRSEDLGQNWVSVKEGNYVGVY